MTGWGVERNISFLNQGTEILHSTPHTHTHKHTAESICHTINTLKIRHAGQHSLPLQPPTDNLLALVQPECTFESVSCFPVQNGRIDCLKA